MRTWKLLGLGCGLFAAAVLVWVYGVSTAQTTTPATKVKLAEGKEAPGKGKRAQEFLAAFNKGDAKTVASFWTPDGDYTDLSGHKYSGRAALEKMYAKLFSENKGLKLTLTVTSARMVGTDTAIEEGMSEVTTNAGNPPSVAAFTAVLVKKDGEWYFESVHESLAQPPSNAPHFEELEFLLGEWTGEAVKGESAQASYLWAENRNFIVSTFATTLNGIPVVGGTQWIAWDAVDKQIRSFSFYSGGGIGEAVWTRGDGKWSVKTSAKSSDGKKISGINVITPVDKDHVTWQMTKLTVDGQAVPDLPPVKMVRVNMDKK